MTLPRNSETQILQRSTQWTLLHCTNTKNNIHKIVNCINGKNKRENNLLFQPKYAILHLILIFLSIFYSNFVNCTNTEYMKHLSEKMAFSFFIFLCLLRFYYQLLILVKCSRITNVKLGDWPKWRIFRGKVDLLFIALIMEHSHKWN